MYACGLRGIRPNVPFIPSRPVYPAGMRIEPPPSPPVARLDEAARHRGRGPGRRPADGAPEAPRVVRDAVDLRDAHVEAAELARGRRAHRHRAAALEQPLDRVRRAVGDAVREDERALAERPALHRVELLDPGGHAAERLGHVGGRGGAVGPLAVEVARTRSAATRRSRRRSRRAPRSAIARRSGRRRRASRHHRSRAHPSRAPSSHRAPRRADRVRGRSPQQGASGPRRGIAKSGFGTGGPFGSCTATA